jgi:branched-chain amino acid transport system substrate-binding protein
MSWDPMRPWKRLGLAALLFAPALAAASQQGVTDSEIVFGMSAPFTGTAKEYGNELKLGLEVAFDEVNRSGGVHGRKLRLVAMDDAYDIRRAQAVIRTLVDEKRIFGIAAAFGTASVESVLPYVISRRVFYYGALTGCLALRNDPPDRYVFNYRPSYPEEIAAIIRYLVEVRRVKPTQIAAFLQEDSAGDSAWVGVSRQMRKYKRDPAQVLRVGYKRNTVDVDAAVRAVLHRASSVRAVVMVGNYKPCAKFIERLRAAGLDIIFASVSVVSPNDLAEQLLTANPRYAEGVIVTQVVPPPGSSGSAILRYREALQRYAPSERPGYVSLEAWIGGHILAEALRRTGPNPTLETFIDTLETIHDLDLGIGTRINFGLSEHQGSHRIWGTVLDASGTYRSIDLE